MAWMLVSMSSTECVESGEDENEGTKVQAEEDEGARVAGHDYQTEQGGGA